MANKRKVLGIGLDGVIRDIYGQFDSCYRNAYIKNESLVEMDDKFNYVESSEATEEEQMQLQRITDEKINYPIDTYDLLNHYSFESREELEEFMHRDYSYQIFAKAEMIPRTMDAANFLQIFGNSTNLFDVVIVAKCKDSSIISTNHFLSKHASKIKNIKFIDEHEDIWNFCDVVISDCPEVFETKPKGKKSVKINHMYNEYSEADYSFDSINYIKSEEFIKKLFK